MIKSADFFVARSPLMPMSDPEWHTFRNNELASEALFLATRTTWNELNKTERPGENLTLTLRKYLKRMTFRCTPFGLFAGISVGRFSDNTNFEFEPQNNYQRLTRFDGDALQMLVDNILSKYDLKRQLRYLVNDSIYEGGNGFLRYLESNTKGGARQFQVSSVEKTPYLQAVLDRAKDLVEFSELIRALIPFEVDDEEAKDFVDELIDSGLLKSELEISVTGDLYFNRLVSIINRLDAPQELKQLLNSLFEYTTALDRSFNAAQIAGYNKIESLIAENFENQQVDNLQLFQVDLFKPARHDELNKQITSELSGVLEILRRLFPAQRNGRMQEFATQFARKFGDSEMSLMELMDPDFGLGYPVNERRESDKAPLIAGLHPPSTSREQVVNMHALHIHLWNECRSSFIDGSPISLNEKSVKNFFSGPLTDLPASFFSIGSLFAKSAEAVDCGDYLFDFEFTAGPSIANLLARFSLHDPKLSNLLLGELKEEAIQYKDAIVAEIVHAAQPRVANVVTRSMLREYEIPILTTPAASGEKIIRLEDLTVRVVDGRVILFSKKINKRVLPRLSSAHNFRNDSLPVYQFLCDLQFEDLHNAIRWDWGGMESFRFLPRVSFGNIIVSKARWFFDSVFVSKNLLEKSLDQVREKLNENKAPSKALLLTNGDLKLKLNLNADDDIKILMYYARVNQEIILVEDLSDERSWLNGPEGSFTNELIIPWRSQPTVSPVPKQIDKDATTKYSVGSRWLYVKIYAGVKLGEEILLNKVAPALNELVASKTIEHWFFIRYADPDFHIRIRCKGDGQFYSTVIEMIHDVLKEETDSHRVWNIQIESYQPELLRYGQSFIESAEIMFFFDSDAVVKTLSQFKGDIRDDVRWQIAALGISSYLDLFQMNLTERIDFFEAMGYSFLSEFNLQNEKEQLKKKYRQFKDSLRSVLGNNCPESLRTAKSIFLERDARIDRVLRMNGISPVDIGKEHCGDVIHMFLNRIFRSKPRFQEAILYDFFCQYFKSQLAIQRQQKKQRL